MVCGFKGFFYVSSSEFFVDLPPDSQIRIKSTFSEKLISLEEDYEYIVFGNVAFSVIPMQIPLNTSRLWPTSLPTQNSKQLTQSTLCGLLAMADTRLALHGYTKESLTV
eukprot:GHVP01020300.1.p1 GENE.GHVP01020300.1~~GHVP01020300.1.p1  ORF type:complete len:109 (+),score=11.93 GHVP01020300.1:871-1197(+)